MTSQVLAEILEKRVECSVDGDHRLVPDGRETTVYVTIGNGNIIVDRAVAFELSANTVTVSTRKDHYVLAYEDVRGIRFGRGRAGAGY